MQVIRIKRDAQSFFFIFQVYVASVGMFRVVEGAAYVARIADSKFHRTIRAVVAYLRVHRKNFVASGAPAKTAR